ncbi:MAG: DoxX family protein [Fimbriimonadaceae bacterium]
MPTLLIAQVAVGLWFTVLFVQSGLDKVFDFKGNLEWLSGHFGQSPLNGVVRPMLATITLVELAAGVLSGLGSVMLALQQGPFVLQLGLGASCAALLMLFFGQRVAKDYPGAATLVPYFFLAVAGFVLPELAR